MKRIAIAAVDEDWGIGKNGVLPWDYIEDRQYFKRCTMNSPCIMGRKTYEDLTAYFKGDTLMPGRFPIVVSGSMVRFDIPVTYNNVSVAASVETAIMIAEDMLSYFDGVTSGMIAFVGGNSIYDYALENDLVDEILLSHIPGKHQCDTFFPRSYMDRYDHHRTSVSPSTGIGYAIYTRKGACNE